MAGDGTRSGPVTRRTVLSGAVAVAAALAGCSGDGGDGDGATTADGTTDDSTTADPTTAETTADPTPTETTTAGPQAAVDEWLSNTSNYDGTVTDATDQSEVTVTVGAEGNGANFAFEPPAIRVSTGTTVVWEWNGKGGQHNVHERDDAFESEQTGTEGHTFPQTFGDPGVVLYKCDPHEGAGMKGAILVE
ncbi:halocyanin domain-containing protein [Halobacteriales archaeon QS_8_69_26]|nr:MAG: halocyanin domain-containing protein [Halobacteriales archaeon QS_8_69_26]